MMLGVKEREQKKDIIKILGIIVGIVCLQMIFAVTFMNSPLPLSFFAKGTNLYGPNIRNVYKNTPPGTISFILERLLAIILAIYCVLYN